MGNQPLTGAPNTTVLWNSEHLSRSEDGRPLFTRWSTPSTPSRGSILRKRSSNSQEPSRTYANSVAPSFFNQPEGGEVVQSTSAKFAITTANKRGVNNDQQHGEAHVTIASGDVVYHNNAIYSPMPAIGGRGSDPSIALFMVEVKLLSDDQPPFQLEVNVTALGQWLYNEVIEHLGGVLEREYFGLRYLDRSKQRQWMDLSKSVYKQLRNVTPRSLNFRVKHYPAKPLEELKQEKSRYFLYLQLRRDLHSGRLIGRNNDMHVLAAHILQAEIGDYEKLEDFLGEHGSLADLKMFENMTPRVETKIREIYKTLQGLSVSDAEASFLERSSELETYGVEPVFVQDRKGNHFYVGLSHDGVTTFRGNRKAHVFIWPKINRISFDGKLFIIQVEWEQRRHTLGFKCQSTEAAEALWKWAVDRQCFFTLNRSVDAKRSKASGRLFRKRQLYTFTGRCQKELIEMTSSLPTIPQPSVKRSRSLLNIAKSVSLSRQTRSHEELSKHSNNKINQSMQSLNKLANNISVGAANRPSNASSGVMRLAGVNSESADCLDLPLRAQKRSASMHGTFSQSNDAVFTSAGSVSVTTTTDVWFPSNSQLPPPAPLKKLSSSDVDVDFNGVFGETENEPKKDTHLVDIMQLPDEQSVALSHGEVMRLVANQRQNSVEIQSLRSSNSRSMKSVDHQENVATISSSPSYMSSNSSSSSVEVKEEPMKSLNTRTRSYSSSSVTSQPSVVHLSPRSVPVLVQYEVMPHIKLETADTGPSESISTSSSSPSHPESPKRTDIPMASPCPSNRSLEPPIAFADDRAKTEPDALYFPYLSKFRNLSDSPTTTPLYVSTTSRPSRYQPIHSNLPTPSFTSITESKLSSISPLRPSVESTSSFLQKRDPFALPSRESSPGASWNSTRPSESFQFSPPSMRQPVKPSSASRFPLQPNNNNPCVSVDNSLLLRHGYTPYRDSTRESSVSSHLDPPKFPPPPPPPVASSREPMATVLVVSGSQMKPVEEPTIVAEYFVPLADDDEDEDSQCELTEMAEINVNPYNWRGLSTPLQTSADSDNFIPRSSNRCELPKSSNYESPPRSSLQEKQDTPPRSISYELTLLGNYESPPRSSLQEKQDTPPRSISYELTTLGNYESPPSSSLQEQQDTPPRSISYELPTLGNYESPPRSSLPAAKKSSPRSTSYELPKLTSYTSQRKSANVVEKYNQSSRYSRHELQMQHSNLNGNESSPIDLQASQLRSIQDELSRVSSPMQSFELSSSYESKTKQLSSTNKVELSTRMNTKPTQGQQDNRADGNSDSFNYPTFTRSSRPPTNKWQYSSERTHSTSRTNGRNIHCPPKPPMYPETDVVFPHRFQRFYSSKDTIPGLNTFGQ